MDNSPNKLYLQLQPYFVSIYHRRSCIIKTQLLTILKSANHRPSPLQIDQLELSASNTVKVDYRLPVMCSDFNSTTVNSLGLDFIDLLPVTLSISYRCLNVVSNTDFYAICIHYYHFSNRIVTNIILL